MVLEFRLGDKELKLFFGRTRAAKKAPNITQIQVFLLLIVIKLQTKEFLNENFQLHKKN
jgi:hypothetical protein